MSLDSRIWPEIDSRVKHQDEYDNRSDVIEDLLTSEQHFDIDVNE
jgi:Arc/MetJ-type ribon-helix-helix transcriptional regulator